jgi:hypothetical protein
MNKTIMAFYDPQAGVIKPSRFISQRRWHSMGRGGEKRERTEMSRSNFWCPPECKGT